MNDLLREVESRGLLKQDFILIDNISTFCSSNLAEQLPAFKYGFMFFICGKADANCFSKK